MAGSLSEHSSEVVGVGHGTDRRMGLRNTINYHGLELQETGVEVIAFESDVRSFVAGKIAVIWCAEYRNHSFIVGFLVPLRFDLVRPDQQFYLNKIILKLF